MPEIQYFQIRTFAGGIVHPFSFIPKKMWNFGKKIGHLENILEIWENFGYKLKKLEIIWKFGKKFGNFETRF